MIRITKQSDYGVVLLAHLAGSNHVGPLSARDLAGATRLPPAMVSKILKSLVHADLVTSTRGVNGGYCLAREPERISLVDVLDAVEGPVNLTECIDTPGACGLEPCCSVRSVWHRINLRVRAALEAVSLAEMVDEVEPRRATLETPTLVNEERR